MTPRFLSGRALPLCVRRHCRGTCRYCEPCAIFEALVSITSCVLIWIGWWDLLELLFPPDWYWRLGMIVVGALGLFATRSMYDKELLQTIRSSARRSERASTSMLAATEMTSSSRAEADTDVRNGLDAANGGSSGANGERDGSGGGLSGVASDAAEIAEVDLAEQGEAGSEAAGGSSSTAKAASRAAAGATPTKRERLFFRAPRPHARKCCQAVVAITTGLTVWVGIWDLVDYELLPLLSNSSCDDPEADPGPTQLWRAPGCIGLKAALCLIGVVGLWATRSLYGDERAKVAQYSRYD